MAKSKRGGPNRGQGPKFKHGEETVQKPVRFPKSVVEAVKAKTDNFSAFVVEAVREKLHK